MKRPWGAKRRGPWRPQLEAPTDSARHVTRCSTACSPSYHRARQWGHACWPAGGAMCGNPHEPCASMAPTTASTGASRSWTSLLILSYSFAILRLAEIGSYKGDEDDAEALCYLELWEAQVLRVCNNTGGERWIMHAGLITSNHLTVLELSNVNLKASCQGKHAVVSIHHNHTTFRGPYTHTTPKRHSPKH